MEGVPVDVRKIILANLNEWKDYLNALESSHYWYSSRDATHYEQTKKIYMQEMKRRAFEEKLNQATSDVQKIFSGEKDSELGKLMPANIR